MTEPSRRGEPAPCPSAAPSRVAIESVQPAVDDGRFAVKRLTGDVVTVSACVFADGHDALACEVRYRSPGGEWRALPMVPGYNDTWYANLQLEAIGRHSFMISGWVDAYGTWLAALRKRVAAGRVEAVDLRQGSELLEAAAAPTGTATTELRAAARRLAGGAPAEALSIAEAVQPLASAVQE
ncbi:MAG: maltotransferase domain-containing protein, partial [Tepidiformaceae bacterium]